MGAAIGVAAGWLIFGEADDSPEPAPLARLEALPPPRTADPVQLLRRQLADETRRRESLERELAAQPSLPPREPPSEPRGDEPESPAPPVTASKAEHPRRNGWIDEPVLAGAGFTPAELEALRERFEAIELKRLFVRDQATREGWIGKPRYRKRMRALNEEYDALRDEYGDDRFDWILFASGRNNRVVVERIMGGSAAEDVGLEVGDVFLRYDAESIFDGQELQALTSSGKLGETVALDVERAGERIRVYPPRGPLGVGLGFERREPAPLY